MRLAWIVVVAASTAWAGKTVILTAGDCADAALINGARDFRDAARPLLGSDVIDDESVVDIVRPRPTRGLQDLERQVEAAKTLFYGGQNERALEQVQRALLELERAEPDSKPWPLTEAALLLQAEIEKNLGHTREMNESFRRVVRINPKVKLNPDAHAPSVIAAVEAIKKDIAKAKKGTLQVRVENGPVANVALDGFVVGTTPLKLEVLPGTYRVALLAAGQLSFPHRVEVPAGGTQLSVEFGFEGSVSRQPPLCVSASTDGGALKLAQLVGAEKVVILRNRAQQGSPTYVSGTLYDVPSATEERTGSVAPSLMGALAKFLITGQSQEGVQQLKPPLVVAAPVEAPPPPPPTDAPAPAVESTKSTFFTPTKTAGVVLLASGVAVAGGGIGLVAGAGSPRAELGTIPLDSDGSIGTNMREKARAAALKAQISGLTAGGISMMVVGGAAAVTGVVLLAITPPGTPVVSAAPTPGGAQVFVSGSF